MAKRQCDQCLGVIPDRMARQRDANGNLLCPSCVGMKQPEWPTVASMSEPVRQEFQRRAAEALASMMKVEGGLSTVAHDSGDNAILNHCPFCGSGAITGGSDGSVECDYCHTVFTVQVQPAHPNMPQTIDGQPMPPPGMPAGQETEMSAPVDPAVDEDASGAPTDGFGAAEADPTEQAGAHDPAADQDPTKPPKKTEPGKNPFAKGSAIKTTSKFFTAEGDVLDLARYADRLALDFADDRVAVLGSIRAGNE